MEREAELLEVLPPHTVYVGWAVKLAELEKELVEDGDLGHQGKHLAGWRAARTRGDDIYDAASLPTLTSRKDSRQAFGAQQNDWAKA